MFQEACSYLGVEHGYVAAIQVVPVKTVLGVGGVSGIIELKNTWHDQTKSWRKWWDR